MNDAVIACKLLLAAPGVTRVLYMDLDVHHGDGVEEAFLFTDRVVTFSMHISEPGFFPCTGSEVVAGKGAGRGAALRAPLRRAMTDEAFVRLFADIAERLRTHFQPSAVVLQCGVDGLAGDPLGGLNLTSAAYTECVKTVLRWSLPVLVLGGGGYDDANAARAWTAVVATCAGTSVPEKVAIQDDFFRLFGPAFSTRTPRPLSIRDENSKEHLDNIVQRIRRALRARDRRKELCVEGTKHKKEGASNE